MKHTEFSSEWLAQRLAALVPGYPQMPLCVALSGGLDSVTLLAALAARSRARGRAKKFLRAVHVHHGLHSNADRWSEHCESVAARFGVPLTVLRVKVARPRGESLEAAARDARYEALGRVLLPGECLLTAHHEDDQLETVLLQLMRGAGVAGLAAMPEVSRFAQGQLVRPLLTRSRAELELWARSQGLSWVDDDSNAYEQLDRNFLRRRVLPLMRERWPSAAASASRTARHAAEARRLLDALALADVERASNGSALSVQRLRVLDGDRRRNAIRFWISRAGFPLPDTRRLNEVCGALLDARADANPEVRWNTTVVQRHADLLSVGAAAVAAAVDADGTPWDWHAAPRIELGAPHGALSIDVDPHGPLDLGALPEGLTVRLRRGGERLRPSRGRPTRTLKALFQESRVPLADRERIPLLFAGDRLLAAGDRWLDASIQAGAATEWRARLRWHRTDLPAIASIC